MFQQRKEYCQIGKKYKCTKHCRDGALSVRLNDKYRVVFQWETPTSMNSDRWTLNASNGKYLYATENRQIDKMIDNYHIQFSGHK